jgi:phage shock protein A
MADEPNTPATQSKTETPSSGATASPLPPVPTPNIDTGYTDAGVPTLDGVRDKIETRYGTALGATELAEETPEVRNAADQYEARQKAAAEKLEEIRASMHKPD